MKSKKRVTHLAIAAAFLLTLSAGAALARGPMGGGGPGASDMQGMGVGPGMAGGMGGGLQGPPRGGPGKEIVGCVLRMDLPDETREAVETLLEVHREAMEADRETMAAAMTDYVAALTAEEIDLVALDAAQATLMDNRQAHAEARFDLELAIVQLLGTDELTALSECMAPPEEETADVE